jgi:RNA polymerase sigma-70 factor (ECF subfamily)
LNHLTLQALASVTPLVSQIARANVPVQDAQDVAQEALAALWLSLDRAPAGPDNLTAWTRRITSARVADYYRGAGRDRSTPVAEFPDTASTDSGPESKAVAQVVWPLVADLPERQRIVLFWRVVVGLEPARVAELAGTSALNVRQLQHRTLTHLRTELGVAAA